MSALVKWDWRLRGQSGNIEVYASEDPEDPGISIAGITCVEQVGPFEPQLGIRPKCSCGVEP